MTPEEFRSHRAKIPPALTMPHTERFIHTLVPRDTKTRDETKNEQAKRLQGITTSTAHTDSLKLKRPTPMKHKSNNLEDVFGLRKGV